MDWVNGILQRDSLGIFHMDRLSLGKPLIIFIVHLGRAFPCAETAGNAFLRVHIARGLNYLDFKVALLPGDAFHLGQGEELNVEMPADLDQFGREDSHGTVVGGEGLVQLGHHAANRGRSLHEVDIITGISQIQCGLHPGNAPTNHHH
jgi:hypothetical protein